MCADCPVGKYYVLDTWANQHSGCGAQYRFYKKSSAAAWNCDTCTDCAAGKYRSNGCKPSSNVDKTCMTCQTCPANEYLIGCSTNADNEDGSCHSCKQCGGGKHRIVGTCKRGPHNLASPAQADAICGNCPADTYAFSGNDVSCDGFVAANVEIKQFSEIGDSSTDEDSFKKHTVWTAILPGAMAEAKKSKYANEVTLSFDFPDGSTTWNEIRFYCRKGDTSELCDTNSLSDHTFQETATEGRYMKCLRADVLATPSASGTCSCRGESTFAITKSKNDCGDWGDGSGHSKCNVDGINCKDYTGQAPVNGVARCVPGSLANKNELDPRPTCSSKIENGKVRVYAILRGLDEADVEYRFKIVIGQSTSGDSDWTTADWTTAFGRTDTQELRVKSQCGCIGSVGDGTPTQLRVRQTWNQVSDPTGNQFQITFNDMSICENGINKYVGDESASSFITVPGVESCFAERIPVVVGQLQDIQSSQALGSEVTYCLQASNLPNYQSEKVCATSVVQWAGKSLAFLCYRFFFLLTHSMGFGMNEGVVVLPSSLSRISRFLIALSCPCSAAFINHSHFEYFFFSFFSFFFFFFFLLFFASFFLQVASKDSCTRRLERQ